MKKEKLKIIAIITAIVVVIASVIGAVIFIYGELSGKKNEKIETGYVVTVFTNTTENYTLIVPVVVDKNGNLADVMSSVKVVNGTAEIEIINTTYGPAMKIDGRGFIQVYGKKNYLFEDGRLSAILPCNVSLKGNDIYWNENLTKKDYGVSYAVIGNTTIYCSPHKGNISIYLSYWSLHVWEENSRCEGYAISWDVTGKNISAGWNEYIFKIQVVVPA